MKAPEQQNSEFDNLFKNRLQELEEQPASHNWDKINRRLLWPPLLSHPLTKVAAILLIGLALSIYWQHSIYPHHELAIQPTPIDASEMPTASILKVEQADHVIDMPDPAVYEEPIRAILESDTPNELEAMLSSILQSDEDLAQKIDQEIIAKALCPLDQLPIEGIAMLPKKNQSSLPMTAKKEIDLKIMIPLRVMSKEELNAVKRRYEP